MAEGDEDVNSSFTPKPCKKCKKVAQSGLKCISCGAISHNSCVANLKNVKVIDDKSIICCELLLESVNKHDALGSAPSTTTSNGSEVLYLKEIIKQKDIIIKNQSDLVSSLKDQITLLNELLKLRNHDNKNNSNGTQATSVLKQPNHNSAESNISKCIQLSTPNTDRKIPTKYSKLNSLSKPSSDAASRNVDINSSNNKQINKQINNSNDNKKKASVSAISNAEVSGAVTRAVTEMKCKELINLDSQESFTTVKYRRKRSDNKPIIGNNSTLTTKLVQSKAFLHVFKLHPDLTCEELFNIISPVFPEATCEFMKSSYPQYYSSFKVTINECNLAAAWVPENWPKGACVNKFFHSRRTKEKTN